MKKDNFWLKLKWMTLGIVLTLALVTLSPEIYAAGKAMSIKVVKGGITLFIDGKMAVPKDEHGNVVEPMIYDGTTYLPLRALSNLLTNYEKEVKWDSKTSSIYIGKAPMDPQIDITKLNYHSNSGMIIKNDSTFNLLDKKITPFNDFFTDFKYGSTVTYLLNSNYKEVSGNLVFPYETIGSDYSGKLNFYNVQLNGEKTLIESFSVKVYEDIQSISVNVSGVNILEIDLELDSAWASPHFYNVILSGI